MSASDGPLNGASLIENGWFMEKNSQWPGLANSLEVKKVLLHKQTKFQDLLVFESNSFGNVLVLDGVVQISERDEMSYQEMMAHLPLFSCEQPKQVLVIGGGDGGVVREVVKHGCVEKVVWCEIDGDVVEASRTYLPKISVRADDPKVELLVGDGVAFAENAKDNSYDAIIVDSSDPVGPAEKLFSKEFYENAHRILRPGGVICSQGECLWNNEDLIVTMSKEYGACYASAEYASMQVPTYPAGQIGAFLARKSGGAGSPSCRIPRRSVPADMELSYYSSEMHAAAFALPAFLQKKLQNKESEPQSKRQKLEWSSSS
eukprot:TRINITY_DN5993_c0_g1_i1.p1 TRINITY_DN5993_c0_g1~~TRINITY_DN5993_c0_g1_i1.p1  ORF type:complete len:326 (+),score=66.19 TRINITY_DN5993_c0_g1_i1:30-980(+)